MSEPFSVRLAVRYFEADQQGVVFHMWYLAYLEDARNAWLARRGLPLRDLVRSGCDLQVVHTELDWTGSVHWGDEPVITVRPAHVGTRSFTLDFDIHVESVAVLHASTVYVTIGRTGAKDPIPDVLRRCLEQSTDEAGVR